MALISVRVSPSGVVLTDLVQIVAGGDPSKFLNEVGEFEVPPGGVVTPPAGTEGEIQLNIGGEFGVLRARVTQPAIIAPTWLEVWGDENGPPAGYAVTDPTQAIQQIQLFYVPREGGGGVSAAVLRLRSDASVVQWVDEETDAVLAFSEWDEDEDRLLTASSAGRLDYENLGFCGFNLVDYGTQSGPVVLDWANGNRAVIELSGDLDVEMTAPAGLVANFLLEVVQDGAGGHAITFGAETRSPVDLPFDYTASSSTIFCIYFNGETFAITSFSGFVSPAAVVAP
jgi:hypothetical protein